MTPLSGIKVLDFSHALAGPYCTLLLGDYGATIYKIESPDGGDVSRRWGPPFVGGESSYFLGLNRGKKGIAVNLKSTEGVALCLRMMEKVDVVVENFRPGTMVRLGLGYGHARARNPRLIYCSISGYGQNGPLRNEPAMDLIVQASSGLISITGTEDGEQVRCGYSVADVTAGMFALVGILMALRAREHSGVGQFVDVSMLDSMISAMTANFTNYTGSGNVSRPMGTAYGPIVPYRTFGTKDREIGLAVSGERLWRAFCLVINHTELIDHPDYATNALRIKNRGVLEPLLAKIFLEDTAENWVAKLSGAGIPVSLVRRINEVVDNPQAVARQMFPFLTHPTAGQVQVTGLPIKFSETPGHFSTPAPLLGQHVRKVLSDLLNIDTADLNGLESRGVILQQ